MENKTNIFCDWWLIKIIISEADKDYNENFLVYLSSKCGDPEFKNGYDIYNIANAMYQVILEQREHGTEGVLDYYHVFDGILYIQTIHKFLSQINPKQLYSSEDEISEVFELFKDLNLTAEALIKVDHKWSEIPNDITNGYSNKKTAYEMEDFDESFYVKCFVDCLKIIYDKDETIWKTYKLKRMFNKQ